MMKISIVPISFTGNFPMGYTVPQLFLPQVEIGGHSVLLSTLATKIVRDDIWQIDITGRLVIPHELECSNIEQIKEIEFGSCFDNGVTAQIWNVRCKVDTDNIMIIDLDDMSAEKAAINLGGVEK